MAIGSVVPPGKKICVINNGAYGRRMAEIARACSIPCVEMELESTAIPSAEKVGALLQEEPHVAVVAMVHHETTTGLLNPVQEVGEVVRRAGRRFVVDAISSFGGIPFTMEEMHMDFCISSSNKCLQGMAGLSFVVAGREALEETATFAPRSYYLHLYGQYSHFVDRGEMRFTPPVQTVYALRQALDEFRSEGAEGRYARYTENWRTLRRGVEERGFRFLLEESEEARLLMTLLEPDHPRFSFETLHDLLYERGFTIYPGKLDRTRTFRLAVLGDLRKEDILAFLLALDEALREMGVVLT